jgi:NarL family two-component system response regulator LiaR
MDELQPFLDAYRSRASSSAKSRLDIVIRVLLIDDHPVVRAGLRALLDREPDIEVVGESGSGEIGIGLARARRPDIVVTDLLMPDVDGVVVTRTICTELPGTPVIVLTSVSEEDAWVVRAIRAGAIGYVLKNADTDALIQSIRAAAAGQAHLSPQAAARLMREARSPNNNGGLTEREREVLREIAAGRTNKQIAQSLHIALSTVKCHVRSVMSKLDADSRTQAALRALKTQALLSDELRSI